MKFYQQIEQVFDLAHPTFIFLIFDKNFEGKPFYELYYLAFYSVHNYIYNSFGKKGF